MNLLLCIPVLLGIIFIGIGILIKLNANKISKDSVIIDGTVIDTVKRMMSSNSDFDDIGTYSHSYSYFPVFEFTYNNQIHKIQYNIGNSKPKFLNGQSVKLHYNPTYPDKVLLCNDKLTNNIYLIFLCIGIELTIIGIVVIKAFIR